MLQCAVMYRTTIKRGTLPYAYAPAGVDQQQQLGQQVGQLVVGQEAEGVSRGVCGTTSRGRRRCCCGTRSCTSSSTALVRAGVPWRRPARAAASPWGEHLGQKSCRGRGGGRVLRQARGRREGGGACVRSWAGGSGGSGGGVRNARRASKLFRAAAREAPRGGGCCHPQPLLASKGGPGVTGQKHPTTGAVCVCGWGGGEKGKVAPAHLPSTPIAHSALPPAPTAQWQMCGWATRLRARGRPGQRCVGVRVCVCAFACACMSMRACQCVRVCMCVI